MHFLEDFASNNIENRIWDLLLGPQLSGNTCLIRYFKLCAFLARISGILDTVKFSRAKSGNE